MTTKHTPGPWKSVGRDVLSMHALPRASGPLVCIVDDNDNSRWPSDARLIAAAPDLLAACESLMEAQRRADAGEHGGFGYYVDAVDLARAAIAKAKGET